MQGNTDAAVVGPTRRGLLLAAAAGGLSAPLLLGGCASTPSGPVDLATVDPGGGAPAPAAPVLDPDLAPDPAGGGFATYRVGRGETLVGLARRFRLGYVELAAANPGIDPWRPGWRTRLVVPTTRLAPGGAPAARAGGLLVNLADMRLYHLPGRGRPPLHYPIGIGRQGHRTPTGATRVVRKAADPPWRPPASVRAERPELPPVVPPGPENPLGSHALYLGWPEYLIHGTNVPWSVGRHASNGCVRLYPEHIPLLFASVPVGTAVAFVHEPVKLARVGGELWLEAHPSEAQADEIEDRRSFTPEVPPGVMRRIARAAGDAAPRVDWDLAKRAVLERRGVATRLTAPASA